MRFTLYYDGPLPARGKPSVKAEIRSALDPQLRELWSHQPLVGHAELLQPPEKEGGLSALVEKHGHTFAAVVSERLGMRPELDILLLRPAAPGDLVIDGDIDNRLKTLFDALSAPAQPSQVHDTMRETSPEDPCHVLLEDDRLITRVNVETDRLLAPASPDHVRLTIRVRKDRKRTRLNSSH